MEKDPSKAKTRLVVFGLGSQALTAANIAQETGQYVVTGFIDLVGTEPVACHTVDGIPVLGTLEHLKTLASDPSLEVIIAIGDQSIKKSVADQLANYAMAFATLIHPNASVATSAEIGSGAIIASGVILEPNAKIGNHAVVRAGCTVSHDVEIGEYASLSPGVTIAGRARIGNGAVIHTGATVIPRVEIGEDAIVGAGSVVTKDVAPSTFVVGYPARTVRRS